jgi:hypothetical protein
MDYQHSKWKWITYITAACFGFYYGWKWTTTISGMTALLVATSLVKWGVIIYAVLLFSYLFNGYVLKRPIPTKKQMLSDSIIVIIIPAFGFLASMLAK